MQLRRPRENVQVPATPNKVHIIAMAHINDSPNLAELAKRLEDILVAEGRIQYALSSQRAHTTRGSSEKP